MLTVAQYLSSSSLLVKKTPTYELGKRLLQYAREANADIICATASPDNAYSIANIERLGFVLNKSLEKYGFSRNLYYQLLNR